MSAEYTILRAKPGPGTGEPFNPRSGSMARSSATAGLGAEAEAVVEQAELNSNEVLDTARDPTVLGLARTMPTALIYPFDVPSTAAATDAWGIAAVRADVSCFTGEGVTVAILDTGIDQAHPAFAGMTLVERDFSGAGDGDRQGHGTHCAGTVFGQDVGGTRIGVARGVQTALIAKVLDDSGSGSSDALFRAIPWAVQGGANVISMSIGFDFPGYAARLQQGGMPAALATSMALEAYRGNMRLFDSLMGMIAAAAAFAPGCVVVAASGNESHVELRPDFRIGASLPAAAEGVLAVGAVEKGAEGLRIADFSNTFPQLCAPGVNVLSAKTGGGLRALSGTSMACPHVAGVAALWWQALRASHGMANRSLVASRLVSAARPEALLPAVAAADRGAGLLTAP